MGIGDNFHNEGQWVGVGPTAVPFGAGNGLTFRPPRPWTRMEIDNTGTQPLEWWHRLAEGEGAIGQRIAAGGTYVLTGHDPRSWLDLYVYAPGAVNGEVQVRFLCDTSMLATDVGIQENLAYAAGPPIVPGLAL